MLARYHMLEDSLYVWNVYRVFCLPAFSVSHVIQVKWKKKFSGTLFIRKENCSMANFSFFLLNLSLFIRSSSCRKRKEFFAFLLEIDFSKPPLSKSFYKTALKSICLTPLSFAFAFLRSILNVKFSHFIRFWQKYNSLISKLF